MLNNDLIAANYYSYLIIIDRKSDKTIRYDFANITTDGQQQRKVATFNVNVVQCMSKLNDSILLCSINGGLVYFNYQRGSYTFHEPNTYERGSPEKDYEIYCVYTDKEGILWLGGINLKKIDYHQYSIKEIPGAVKKSGAYFFNNYFDLYLCSDNDFLLGGFNGVAYYNNETAVFDEKLKEKDLSTDVYDNRKYGFVPDATGNIWFHSDHSIYRLNIVGQSIKEERKIPIAESLLPGFIISDLKPDNHGHIILATTMGLLIKDTVGRTIKTYNTEGADGTKLTNITATNIFIDRAGNIWVGTLKGLNKITKAGIVKQYQQPYKGAYFPSWKICDIVEDKNGMIWFSTTLLGIGRLDPVSDSIAFFSIKQGLPSAWYQVMRIDSSDILWAKSSQGILKFNTQTLQSEVFNEESGFPPPADIRNLFYSYRHNKIYLFTRYAILEVNDQKSGTASDHAVTGITAFSVYDVERTIPANSTIYLNYKENFINIQFACMQFHNNNQVKYAYKIDGIDENWVYCNFKRNAVYTDLAPGRYVFHVKSLPAGGKWTVVTDLSIIIRPPFWKEWWFYLMEAMASISAILWIIKLYTVRKLTKQKIEFEKKQAVSNERVRIASDMHDELGSSLTSIRLLSEVAVMKATNNTVPADEIQKVLKLAGNLSENLREIIWTMNSRFDKLDDFTVYVRSYTVEYFDNSTIDFDFIRPAVMPQIMIPGQVRRNIFLSIKEALHNIVKHSGATAVSLSMEVTNNDLTIAIKDNGNGTEINNTSKFGNGLNSMKGRMEQLGGQLEIDANAQGTSLCLVLK